MTNHQMISEVEAERIADQRVQRQLASDPAYRNAENAEQQSRREDEISEKVWNDINKEYNIR